MPDPFAIPPSRTSWLPICNSNAWLFATKSVVRIAVAAAAPASELAANASTKGSIAVNNTSIGIGTPITPVEQINTSSWAKPSRSAKAAVALKLSIKPRSPVQALAWPEFISTALAVPWLCCNLSTHRSTQPARTMFVVKTPAATAASGAKRSARSCLPLALSPAVMPAALKPFGAVMPPLIGCH